MKPSLYIMVGLPGSGKDTIAKQIRDKDALKNILLSSDDLRIELFGWEDQSKNGIVFDEMNKKCKDNLQKGFNVIYNATNLSRKKRRNLIDQMKRYADVNAILCLAPIGTILDRNLTRYERYIPEYKLIQMFQTIDIPLKYEGFNKIYYVNTDNRFDSRKMIDWFLEIGKGYDQNNEHHNATVQEHLLLTAQIAATKDVTLYDAGRFHDIGKPYSREWNDVKQKYTYYNHHNISAYLYLLYSTYDNNIQGIQEIDKYTLDIATLIYHHMDKFVGNLEKTKELLGEELYQKLEILMEADAYREEK